MALSAAASLAREKVPAAFSIAPLETRAQRSCRRVELKSFFYSSPAPSII
jgi:hypothetical protein